MSAPIMLVTGGSRGIGAAIVQLAAERGYDVAFTYARDTRSAAEVAAHAEKTGRRILPIQADMGTESEILRSFAAVDAFGPLDALICNSAITGQHSTLAQVETSTLRSVLDVNILGPMLCAREAIRRMSREHGGAGGSIVLVSSRAALYGSPGEYVWYAASKGALDSLNAGLAREVGPQGIRVNAVSPGPIATEMHRAGRLEQVAPNNPMRRAGTAHEVAEAVMFLASAAASYVNGANISVSGGV